jgi:hypothetical protein
MKYVSALVVTLIFSTMSFMLLSSPASAGTPFSVSVSGDSKGINEFNLSIGEYYRVPEREVVVVHERGIDEEELPVVFFLAQRARVRPEVIVDLRLRGMNWMDITLHYGLNPDIYYVPVKVVRKGPPYGNAYGYYKKHKKKDWKKIRLSDADIVNQVNLRFISEHHGYSPEQVMRYRSEGRKFAVIDRDIRTERHGGPGDKNRVEGRDKGWKEDRHNGPGKGKGKKWEDN